MWDYSCARFLMDIGCGPFGCVTQTLIFIISPFFLFCKKKEHTNMPTLGIITNMFFRSFYFLFFFIYLFIFYSNPLYTFIQTFYVKQPRNFSSFFPFKPINFIFVEEWVVRCDAKEKFDMWRLSLLICVWYMFVFCVLWYPSSVIK